MVKNPPVVQVTRESWVRFHGWEDPEEGVAVHSVILSRETLWIEKIGGLQSMGL